MYLIYFALWSALGVFFLIEKAAIDHDVILIELVPILLAGSLFGPLAILALVDWEKVVCAKRTKE